jgi:alpha-glucosidase
MTESYSPPDTIKKFYEAGSDLPFNFQMINQINRDSSAKNFIDMVTEWNKIVPDGKSTNWVVSMANQ